MRVLTFRGRYSYQPGQVFTGLVCFCHFEAKDTSEKVKLVAREIASQISSEEIILVPFSHLHESVLSDQEAKNFFEGLGELILEISQKKVVMIPFGVTKELHLNVEADDSAVRFFHF